MIKLKQLSLLAILSLGSAFLSMELATAATQYTPNQADWETLTNKPLKNATSHDPDDTWLSAESWKAAKWDGTIYHPYAMSKADFHKAICPTNDQIRGLREVYYQKLPFVDNVHPTKAEVDEWHRIVINHIRALVGYTSEERKVKPDHCLFARTLWSDERKYTRQWDSAYPDNTCATYKNQHCGATFIPKAVEQVLYLPKDHATCSDKGDTDGVFPSSKSDIPWSIKVARTFCYALGKEGFWGGHVGPWYMREKFGLNFWDNTPGFQQSTATVRAKFGGKLSPPPTEPNKVASNVKGGDFTKESHPNASPIKLAKWVEHYKIIDGFNGTTSWIMFSGFNFGGGANTIYVTTSAQKKPTNAAISVRLDSPTGAVIARVTPVQTYHLTLFNIQKAPLSPSVTGVRDLYLTFEGSDYNLNSFRFEKE